VVSDQWTVDSGQWTVNEAPEILPPGNSDYTHALADI
jgi:hypothetical protein